VPWSYQPRPLGPEDVQIKISHCGICASDVHTLESAWNEWNPTTYPCVVGHEIVGIVEQIGSQVTNMSVGDRVGVGAQVLSCMKTHCKACSSHREPYCPKTVFTYSSKYEDGATSYGGYAERMRVSSHFAFKIPENIASEFAAPLLCAGATVFSPLKQHGVSKGDRVGVVGIGGLGHLALQFIKALGAVPVAFSHTANKEAEARSLGAAEFVNMNDDESVAKASNSVSLLLVTSNVDNLPYGKYLNFLADNGKLVILGVSNGAISFNAFSLLVGGRSMSGSMIAGIDDIKLMLEVASLHDVRPVIQKMSMDKVNEGIDLMVSGKVRYRVVLENSTDVESA